MVFMKRRILYAAVLAAVYLVCFVMLGGYDLAVSDYLTSHISEPLVFAGARFGPFPMFLFPSWCLKTLFGQSGRKILSRVTSAAAMFPCAYMIVSPSLYTMKELLLIGLLWVVLWGAVQLIPEPEVSDSNSDMLANIILICTGAFLMMELMKLMWGRPRFVAILGDDAQFREWYSIAGFSLRPDYYRSFPSGHTVCASASICMTLLPDLFPEQASRRGWYWGISLLYTAFVAMTRIMAGMHFVTDVMAGFALFMLWYWGVVGLYRNGRIHLVSRRKKENGNGQASDET